MNTIELIMTHSEYLKKEAKKYNAQIRKEIKAIQGGVAQLGLSKAHKQMSKTLDAITLINNGQSAIVSEKNINIVVNNCKKPSIVQLKQIQGTKMFILS